MLHQLLKTVIAFICLSLCSNSHAQDSTSFTIQGKAEGIDSSTVGVSYANFASYNSEGISFSAQINKGRFVITGTVPEPGRADFYINGSSARGYDFYLDGGNYNISYNKTTSLITVNGNKQNDIYQGLKPHMYEFFAAMHMHDSLVNRARSDRNMDLRHFADSSFSKAQQKWMNTLRSEVNKEQKNYVVLNELLPAMMYDENLGAVRDIYSQLNPVVRFGITGKLVLDQLNRAEKIAVGHPFPFFEAMDVNGKKFTPANYKGNFVLIDFWASYCEPCRAQNFILKKCYESFHAQGLDIVGISEDTDSLKWKRAVAEDNVPWYSVADLKGIKEGGIGALAKLIPQTFILNRSGIIVAKGRTGSDLYDKLQQVITAK